MKLAQAGTLERLLPSRNHTRRQARTLFHRAGSRLMTTKTWSPTVASPRDLREKLAPDSEGAMRKARFTGEQTVAIIREADRKPVSVVAKRHGVSDQTIYRWHKRWRHYNAVRPHSTLGYLTPNGFAPRAAR
jgi:Transposase